MEPGTLDTTFASLCNGSLAQPESLLAHSRHCHPPAPPGLFPGRCTKAIQSDILDQRFPALEFWWQYQRRETLPCLPLSGYSNS